MYGREELSESLKKAKSSAKKRGGSILYTDDISRSNREILLHFNWIQPIVRGWYMLVNPKLSPGESTYWYANFWKFISEYLNHLYKKNYCLSAELSLDLHTSSTSVPKQVVVIVKKGGGNVLDLPFGNSLVTYQDPKNFPDKIVQIQNVNVMDLPYALCRATPSFFVNNPQEAEIALRMIDTPDQLLEVINTHKLKSAGDRFVGAYNFLEDSQMAEGLMFGLETLGAKVNPNNPFLHQLPITTKKFESPYANRVFSMWKLYRTIILDIFPKAQLSKVKKKRYFQKLEEIYERDAYNSLSIEGFDVSEELIEKVKNQEWNPDESKDDHELKNALSAKGYHLAFQEVKMSIDKIFQGENSGEVIKKDLQVWYKKLFTPFVEAQLLDAIDLIRYRKHQVYIRNSRHIPLPVHALNESMSAFFECLINENEASVRAVLGHFMFVFIHPYMDGNGRLGRFLMNIMFASGGYPWTIVELERRSEYLDSLEKASVEHDIKPLAKFLLSEIKKNG